MIYFNYYYLYNIIIYTILIGFSFATGVRAPVLPTLIIISFIIVVACSAFNFPAIAHLGDLLLIPKRDCWWYELTLKTTPSIS